MQSQLEGFSCDVFISYRQNDNKSGWVSGFVSALRAELATLIKEPVSVYFDTDPHEGLQETHLVDKSIERRLRSLVFIPIVSQTYCDPDCFAWKNEFCSFNRLASQDRFGRDIDLRGGNVGSRILPVRIHDLEPADERMLEDQLGHPPRFVDMVYRSPGMNRPLRSGEELTPGGPRFEDQVNKVALAIKEIIIAMQDRREMAAGKRRLVDLMASAKRSRSMMRSGVVTLLAIAVLMLFKKDPEPDPVNAELDRAEKYLEESQRFGDKRYRYSAHDVLVRVLNQDSLNERALFLMIIMMEDSAGKDKDYKRRLLAHHPDGVYALMTHAGDALDKGNRTATVAYLNRALTLDPDSKDALGMYAAVSLLNGDYLETWTAARRYQRVHKEGLNDLLSTMYLELGDFQAARDYLQKKRLEKEFSCYDLEMMQRIRLCAGEFDKLEAETDSICRVTKCEDCPLWQLRAKMHTGKFAEAYPLVRAALKQGPRITWRLPAYVMFRLGKADSALLLSNEELKYDREKLADTAYAQSIPLYSMAAISAMRGEHGASLEYLKRYADRGFEMGSEWYIAHDPLFDEAQKNNEYFADFIQLIQKAQAKKNAVREKIRELE